MDREIIAPRYSTPLSTAHHIHLSGDIEAPEYYDDVFQVLIEATENDFIHLYINTDGGYAATAIQFIHLISQCSATVIGHAIGEVASAGSLIFFSCHAHIVYPLSRFTLHIGSGGQRGKTNDNLAWANADMEHSKMIFKAVYSPFITQKEMGEIVNGREMILFADDVQKRLDKADKKSGH